MEDGGICTPILELTVTFHSENSQTSEQTLSKEENEIKNFMILYVAALFDKSVDIHPEQKAIFGQYVQTEKGQTWFGKIISSHRASTKCVPETIFYRLVQHFAIVLFECSNSDNFTPAKTLMNMCLTFYHEVKVSGNESFPEYLTTYLKNQPIWQNIRFWNAAFFDALQSVRIQRPVLTQEELLKSDFSAVLDEDKYQKNITFGQLGTFICTMHAFGLDKHLCENFLEKQCTIASLPHCQKNMLENHMHKLYDKLTH